MKPDETNTDPIATVAENDTTEPTNPAIQQELDKINDKKSGKTELQKAIYTRQQIDKRIQELSGDTGEPAAVVELDQNKPLTIADLNRIEAEKAARTALSLAESIVDPKERELTIHHLNNTIRPSGDPQQDLAAAVAIVNNVKNTKIAEELSRTSTGNRSSSVAAAGAPAKKVVKNELTAAEKQVQIMFGTSTEGILKARERSQAKQQ